MSKSIVYTVTVDENCTRWCLNGKLHRENGPAVELADGTKYWWLNGHSLTEEDHAYQTNTVIELTIDDIERLLGKKIKIVS